MHEFVYHTYEQIADLFTGIVLYVKIVRKGIVEKVIQLRKVGL